MTPRASPGDDPGAGAKAGAGRGRRVARLLGVLLLAAVLIAFIVSFITGLGAGPADGTRRPIGDARRGGEQLDRMGPRIRVEVLNAAGVSGLARAATEQLRDRGFDVVYIGNAGAFDEETTVVIARTADVDAAHDVARALGVDSVLADPDAQLYLDATVRLGRDWPPDGSAEATDAPGLLERARDWFGSDTAADAP